MNVRKWCVEALYEICDEKMYSNLYLQHHLHQLNEQDRALASMIVYGTLQNQRYVRYQWEHMVKRLPDKRIMYLLDMSIYQLLFLDAIPAYAIIHEAVELSKQVQPKAKGLVNGVLRRFQREGERKLPKDEWKAISLRASLPEWIVQMWKSQYGEEACKKICESINQIHPQCVRVNVMKTSREKLMETGKYRCGCLSKDALYLEKGNAAESEEYKKGDISIQSEASQMVALWMDPQPNERILDVCSAPGSKAAHMAEHMHNQGLIVCGDIHPHRVELIKQGAKRLSLSILDAHVMDATKLEEVADAAFDGVLCDVPCTGYGVMGRKSDIKTHLNPSAMDTLIPLQYAILCCASKKVRPNGRLIYSTCTLNKKENEKQVMRFLKEHPSFLLQKEQTIFPYEHGTDGFYIALLLKKEE